MERYEIGSYEAKKDLGHISSYILYELKAPQAAEAVMADLESAIDSLALLPDRIPLAREDSWKKQGIHAMVIRNYLIYFLIDEAKH